MKSTGSKAATQPLWIVVSEERSLGYFHLHAKVTTDRFEQGDRVPYGLDDSYSFEGKPLLSGLRASCQGDDRSQVRTDGQEPVYGYDVCFRSDYARDVKLHDAARMVKTLTRVQRGFEKLSASRGHVKTYGEYIGRLAEVLGAKGICLQKTADAARRSGQTWEWLSIGDGVNRIDHRVFLWSQDGIDRAQGHSYQVLVGNLGTVHRGSSRRDAEAEYDTYVQQSREDRGRAAGEPVSLWKNGEPVREYRPAETEPETSDEQPPAPAAAGEDQL